MKILSNLPVTFGPAALAGEAMPIAHASPREVNSSRFETSTDGCALLFEEFELDPLHMLLVLGTELLAHGLRTESPAVALTFVEGHPPPTEAREIPEASI